MYEASFTRVVIVPPESPLGGATERKILLKAFFKVSMFKIFIKEDRGSKYILQVMKTFPLSYCL